VLVKPLGLRLHLLFVVSRPRDAGFIDPRTDPQAVLDALEDPTVLEALLPKEAPPD